MNYYYVAGLIPVVVLIATSYAIYSFSPMSVNSSTLLDRDYVLAKVKDAVPNSYGLFAQVMTSDAGFDFGGVGPVGPYGAPDPSSRAVFISTEQELWMKEIYLCGPDRCISDRDEDGSGGESLLAENDFAPYEFSNLDKVTWKQGDEVHIWIKIYEEVPEIKYKDENGRIQILDPPDNSRWVDVGVTTIEPCTDEYWCPDDM